jgi:tRNA threonylcarbamoyladenosine biosynthesis protein TsaE
VADPGYRVLPTVADTEALGRELATNLRAGDLVVLDGPLGAGKTALTRGIAAGLGVQGRVSSPTFIIARQHRAGQREGGPPVPMVHVDAYRLGGDLDELDALDHGHRSASGGGGGGVGPRRGGAPRGASPARAAVA